MEKFDLAESELLRAIELNPNHALSHRQLGTILLFSGRTDEAIPVLQNGSKNDPYSIISEYWKLGLAYYLKGRYTDAIKTFERVLSRDQNSTWTHLGLAAAFSQEGRSEEALHSADIVKRLNPFFELESSFSLFRNPADREKIIEGLRKAGLK